MSVSNIGQLLLPVLLVLLTSHHLATESILIFVSHSTGNDTTECFQRAAINDSSPATPSCATLDYTLKGIHQNAYRNVGVLLNATSSNTHFSMACNRTITTWEEMEAFELIGIGGVANIDCTGHRETGLTFINSSNVRLVNVSIVGCGLTQNSSSADSDSMTPPIMRYKTFTVAVYLLLCNNVTVDRVTISGSQGVALVLYSTGGTNAITSCTFKDNGGSSNSSNPAPSQSGGGGMAIEYLYCIPGDVNCAEDKPSMIPTSNYQNVDIRISGCVFDSNYGQSSDNSSIDAFIIPNKNHNVALGRGGGLGIVFKGNASNNRVVIESCKFTKNTALWGGGALFEFQDTTRDNVVMVTSSQFTNNKCKYDACNYSGTGGGGVRVLFAGFESLVKNNSVKSSDVSFDMNKAYFGGGTSIMTFPEVEQTTNTVQFTNVSWSNNTARLGSAVDLSVWHLTFNGSVIRPVFIDSSFSSNTIDYAKNLTGVAQGVGTIYADTVPVAFGGVTNFLSNFGSCVYVVEADVEFLENSLTRFTDNKANSGAGISLHGNSYMQLYDRSEINFTNNKADLYGGAIYWVGAGNRFLISTRNCFIRFKEYLLNPERWPVVLRFDNNTAGITGNNIFGTTLLGCLWGGQPFGNFSHKQTEYHKVFNWNSSIWIYSDSYDNNSIATSPSHFGGDLNNNNEPNCSTKGYVLEAIPGSYAGFNKITMANDMYGAMPADSLVFAAIQVSSSTNKSLNNSDNLVQYISPSNDMVVNGSEQEVRNYSIFTLHPRVISSQITLKFTSCPLGFIMSYKTSKCEGGSYLNLQTHTNFSISLQKGYWVGRTMQNQTFTAQCFFCPFNKNISSSTDADGNYILISVDSATSNESAKINQILCDGLNREGEFCQHCKANYSPSIASEEYKCVKCDHSTVKYAWLIYILRKFLPITVVLFLVIIFRISVTSGPANSFVLFAQVISTTFAVNVGQTLDYRSIVDSCHYSPEAMRKVYISLYSIWNLDFLEPFYGGTCLGPNITTLHLLSFKFITACYPLSILFIVAVVIMMYDKGVRAILCLCLPFHRLFARCVRAFDINRSIMDAFATFLVLSYVKFATTSALLLYPLQLYGENGKPVGEKYSFFEPETQYWSSKYAPYLIVSFCILVFVCFCLPILLLLYSLRPFYSFLEKHYRFRFLLPGEKFKLFLNSFYHCYKDGRDGEHDRRYFCSFYFFARLFLIFAYSYSSNWIIQLMFQQAICTFAIAVVSIFQPYKNQLYNIVDSLMFTVLAVINTMTIYQIHLATTKSSLSLSCYIMQVIFIFIPILYIIGLIIYQVILKCHNYRVQKQKNNAANFENGTGSASFSFGEFMQDVQPDGRLEHVGPYHPHPVEEEEEERINYEEIPNVVGPITDSGLHSNTVTVSVIDVDHPQSIIQASPRRPSSKKRPPRRTSATTGRSRQQHHGGASSHRKRNTFTSVTTDDIKLGELSPLLHS